MSPVETLRNFILHVGTVDQLPACALLRVPGERALSPGRATVHPLTDGTADVELHSPAHAIRLGNVEPRHVELIKARGLFVIQRPSQDAEPQILHLEYDPC